MANIFGLIVAGLLGWFIFVISPFLAEMTMESLRYWRRTIREIERME